jgi:hypothetical protein
MNSERFLGVDSDSEDYEVDDHVQVEQQMKELGVNVTVHPSMLEDFAIQSAAVGIAPPLAVTSNDTGHFPATTLAITAPKATNNEPSSTGAEWDPWHTGGNDTPLTNSGSVLAPHKREVLPNGPLDPLLVPPLGVMHSHKVINAYSMQQGENSQELHSAQPLARTAPGLGFTYSDAFGGARASHSSQMGGRNMDTPLCLGTNTSASRSAEGECTMESVDQGKDITPIRGQFPNGTAKPVNAPQPDPFAALSRDKAAIREDVLTRRLGELPRILLRPRGSSQVDDLDYVTSLDGDQSPVRGSPRKSRKKPCQPHVSGLRCDTLHNTLVQAHNAGAFQTTLSDMGAAKSLRSHINTAVPLSPEIAMPTLPQNTLMEVSNAVVSAKWLTFAAATLGAGLPDSSELPGGIHARLIPLLFSHEMDCMATAQEKGVIEWVNSALGIPKTSLATSHPQQGGNCVREEFLLAAVAHATEQQEHLNPESPVQHISASANPAPQTRRSRTRPIRPPPRSQDMISLDEDIDGLQEDTPKRRASRDRPLQWARKRSRTAWRESASLTTGDADTLSEQEDELRGVAGLLKLANSSDKLHTAIRVQTNVSPHPQHVVASKAVGMLGTTSNAFFDPVLGLPAVPLTPTSLVEDLGMDDIHAQLNELLSTNQRRSAVPPSD